MAGPGIPLGELTEHWPPIFVRPGWRYDPFREVVEAVVHPGVLLCQVRTGEGHEASLEVQWLGEGVLRLRAWAGSPPPGTSPMLASAPRPRPQTPALRRHETGMRASLPPSTVEVSGPPFTLRICTGRRYRWGTATHDASLVGPTVLPLGIATTSEGRQAFFLSWHLSHNERLYGLGEAFGRLDRRGSRAFLWCRDMQGTIGPGAYIVVPFLLSSRGYGLFLHQSSPSVWELGDPYPQSASLLVEDPYLDIFLLLAQGPGQLLQLYTGLTGRAPLVPLWALGIWWSRCMYRDRQQVEQVASRLRELGIPGDVIHLDPLWLEGREGRQRDGCHFRWSRERFGEPQELAAWLRGQGFRLSLWENPYVWRDTQLHQEGAEKGYLVRSRNGELAASLENPEATPVDFTNPEAVAWWQSHHRPYLRAGVAVFKADYGEGLPADALMADGSDGRRAHNLYPLLYNRAVYQVVKEERDEGVIFARSGYAGSQRYPVHWLGDTPSTWEGMAAALRAGLSLSLSGFALWGHDIGGFWNPEDLKPPPPDLYVRWAQWGLLSPVARFHGIRGREPWYYGQRATLIVRRFARLRYRLLPYLSLLVQEAAITGLPLARPLFLQFPDDQTSWQVDWQFMLGPWLLVAPVLNPEGVVDLYLPPGAWHHWWTGEKMEGPRWHRLRVPLERMPLLVRGDSLLPLAPAASCVDRQSWSPLTLQVRLHRHAQARLWARGRPFLAEAQRQEHKVVVRLSRIERRIDLELLEPAAVEVVQVRGADLVAVRRRRNGTTLSLRVKGEMELEAVAPGS